MENNENKENQLEIELSEEIAEGLYCNFAIITHSPHEFVTDFIRMMPGVPKSKVKTRVIMTPEHTKRLTMALMENIRKFEEQFGEIAIKDQQDAPIPMNYSGQTGMA
ncbi:MAG: DUF3467 domain-containing protein [Bacteroidia bacterium]|jgi:hypothetical protein|nr:DUF3467 domain-containing protein [Bacteroidia bacterium]